MSKLGKCCCCACLTDAEMPNISIGGYIGQGWIGGDPEFPGSAEYCCYSQEFLPTATFDWTKICTQPLNEAVLNQVRTGENIAIADDKAKVFEGCFPNASYPCPLPDAYCCDGWTSALMSRNRAELTFTRGKVMKLFYRPSKIQVFMFRAELTCPGQSGSCKIGIIVKKTWEYKFQILDYWSKHETMEITEVGDCFKKNPSGKGWLPGYPVSGCQSDECEFDITTSQEPDCYSDFSSGLLTESLSRMKIFDEMPTENQIFNDADLGTELCIGGICYDDVLGWYGTTVGDTFYSSVCIESPTTFNPCWCSASLQYLGSLVGQSESSCTCYPGAPPIPGNLSIICCEEPQTVINGNCCDESARTCPTYSCDKGKMIVAPNCGDTWDGDINRITDFCGSNFFSAPFPFDQQCFGSSTTPLGTCVIQKSYAESPGCYYDQPCDQHIFVLSGGTIGNQLNNALSINCTGNVTREVCLLFGTLTLVFNDE